MSEGKVGKSEFLGVKVRRDITFEQFSSTVDEAIKIRSMQLCTGGAVIGGMLGIGGFIAKNDAAIYAGVGGGAVSVASAALMAAIVSRNRKAK